MNSVFLHPNTKDYVLVAGCSVVIGDLSDPHSQNFLTAHDDQITCIAIANNGSLIASGKVLLCLMCQGKEATTQT